MVNKSFNLRDSEIIQVDQTIRELIPDFLNNKLVDLYYIQAMIQQNDFDAIRKMGHKWKGSCPSYGFHYLGEVGEQFEILVQNKDYEKLKALVQSLESHLKNVRLKNLDDQVLSSNSGL